ncbi:MAG TPA: serine/threonine-protein kinase [Aquihabitans sp.]|nr:serine/threonine-protein kinase [Aquihabitans sp.]
MLDEPIGRGAMGEVWRGHVVVTGEAIAAKLLHEQYTSDREVLTRFVQERSILVSLDHPNLVRVKDLVVEGDDLAIVMELVEGADLRKHLDERRRLEPAEAVRLTAEVLDALAVAHAARILHRDIKPDNVLLDGSDGTPRARLSDFGIARLAEGTAVRMSQLIGTPEYLAPEVISTDVVTSAADVYACGILLYELLAGRTPFAGQGAAYQIIRRQVEAQPPPVLGLPEPLENLLQQLLRKDPAGRPDAVAAAAMLRALLPDLAGVPTLAEQPPVDWSEPRAFVDAPTSADRGTGTIIRGDEGAEVLEELAEAPVWVPPVEPEADDRGTQVVDAPVRPRTPGPTIVETPPVAPVNRTKNRRNLLIAAGAIVAIAAVVAVALARSDGGGDDTAAAADLAAGATTVSAQNQQLGLLAIDRTYEVEPPEEGSDAGPTVVGVVTYRADADLSVPAGPVREYLSPSLLLLSTAQPVWEEGAAANRSDGVVDLDLPELQPGDEHSFRFTLSDVDFSLAAPEAQDDAPVDPEPVLQDALADAEDTLARAVDGLHNLADLDRPLRWLAVSGVGAQPAATYGNPGDQVPFSLQLLYGPDEVPQELDGEVRLALGGGTDPISIVADNCSRVGQEDRIKLVVNGTTCEFTPNLGRLRGSPATIAINA